MSKRRNDNDEYNHYINLIKDNGVRKVRGSEEKIYSLSGERLLNKYSKAEAKTLADNVLNEVGRKYNDPKYHHEIPLDTVAVGITDNDIVISANLKQRRPAKVDSRSGQPQEPCIKTKMPEGGSSRVVYDDFGISKGMINDITEVVHNSNLYKDSPFNVKIIEEKVSPKTLSNNMADQAAIHGGNHAEMKTLSHASDNWDQVNSIGISKPACEGCYGQLDGHGVDVYGEKGQNRVTHWKEPENISTKVVYTEKRNKSYVVANDELINHNIKFSKQAFKDATKNNIKKGLKPGGSVGLISGTMQIINTIETNNVDPFADGDVLNAKAGVCDNMLGVGKIAYAGASVVEAKAGVGGVVGVGVSALSASAHAEYGLNNSVGVNASLVRAQANVGPVNLGVGLNLDCNASVGVNGVGATFLGMGFNIGPSLQLKTPFFDFSFNLF